MSSSTGTTQINVVIVPDLKEQLRELALIDIDKFVRMTGGTDVIIQVTVCMEREKGRSFQAIANKLKQNGFKISRQSVGDRCKKCKE